MGCAIPNDGASPVPFAPLLMHRPFSLAGLAGRCILAALAFLPAPLSAQWIRDGFNSTQHSRGDYAASDPITLGFSTNIRGSLDDQTIFGNIVHVCTDGFVTFGPFGGFCPYLTSPATIEGAFTALAPLYRDLNLPGTAQQFGGSIGWGTGIVDGRSAWGATWQDVLTWTSNNSTGPSFRNSFQLVLIERSDRAVGDFDVEFNYGLLGLGYDGSNVFAGAYDMGGLFDPDGNPYDEYYYTVAPTPLSRITMCWVGGSVSNAACTPGTGGPIDLGTPVPEPSTWALMAAGLGALFLSARRRRA